MKQQIKEIVLAIKYILSNSRIIFDDAVKEYSDFALYDLHRNLSMRRAFIEQAKILFNVVIFAVAIWVGFFYFITSIEGKQSSDLQDFKMSNIEEAIQENNLIIQ